MRILATFLLTTTALLAQEREKTHLDFRAEALAAYQRKDYTAAKEATLAALDLRPDSPRYLHNLAALCALTRDPASALDYLRQIAALGVATPVERDPDLASLQGTPQFAKILHELANNRSPQGEAEVVAELPGRTGIIEGIAFRDRTGDLFLGDVHHRCIWRRDRDGRIARFSAEDEQLLGILAIAIDEPRNTLWATMAAGPEMSGFAPDMQGQTALAEFNLGTSELRRVISVPGDGREHRLGDLFVASDGTIFLSDSKAPVVWQLAPGAEEMQKVADSPLFGSLQGLTVENRTLLIADYLNGLFTIELATGNITALLPPKNTTLVGIDGLVTVPGGIVAIQNGVDPQRVIRVTFNPQLDTVTGVTVLAAALPNLTDLCLVTLVNQRPTLIAGAGWDLFDATKSRTPPAHTVRIFQVSLP
jgi:sugar lactone lactonase YvrE